MLTGNETNNTGSTGGGDAELEALRKRIDELDSRLVSLLNDRARVVVDIGHLKKARGTVQVYSADREQAVLKHIAELNKGPLSNVTLTAVWRELMSGSLALERPLKIVYLGPDGSFSHLAALQHFGSSVQHVAVNDIASVFDWVEREHGDYGIVPVENTTGGSINDTLSKFLNTTVTVCAELAIPIHQNLLANCSLAEIQRVYSKPQVFDQCRRWLQTNLPKAELVEVSSTTTAAQRAAEEAGAGAIASKMASRLYGVNLLCPAIEDNSSNLTRFLVLGREGPRPTGHDKTSLLFSVRHRHGALVEVLKSLHDNSINMTRIESHPSPFKRWEYYFFVDVEGHRDDAPVKAALAEARKHCVHFEVLGSYPRAVTHEPVD